MDPKIEILLEKKLIGTRITMSLVDNRTGELWQIFMPRRNEIKKIIGLYATFHYIGLNTDTKIFEYIYETSIPTSIYTLDSRPHFEILGEKYKKNDLNSEENIWIPIKVKK